MTVFDIFLGHRMDNKEKFYVSLIKLFEKHCEILSKTGGGKSYCAGVIIEELAKTGVRVLILDPHGEYSSLIKPNPDLDVDSGICPDSVEANIYTAEGRFNRFTIPTTEITAKTLQSFMKINEKKREALFDVFRSLKPPFTVKKVVSGLIQRGNLVLAADLDEIDNSGVFGEGTDLRELTRPGINILDIKVLSEDIQIGVVSYVLEKIWAMQKKIPEHKRKPIILFAEECHIFAPQDAKVASKKMLTTIVKEGRKFGISLCAISQRPQDVDKKILSQPAVQIFFKITNENDLEAIRKSVENVYPGFKNEVQELGVGEAIICGIEGKPFKIKIRLRRTKHGAPSAFREE